MVEEAVGGNEQVESRRFSDGGFNLWEFEDRDGNMITLSRTSDGSRPDAPTRPYLGVHYWNNYDFQTAEVVSAPQLSVNGSSPGECKVMEDSPLAREMIASLGLREFRIQQRIEFQVQGPQPKTVLNLGPDGITTGFVNAQPRAIADLPPAV